MPHPHGQCPWHSHWCPVFHFEKLVNLWARRHWDGSGYLQPLHLLGHKQPLYNWDNNECEVTLSIMFKIYFTIILQTKIHNCEVWGIKGQSLEVKERFAQLRTIESPFACVHFEMEANPSYFSNLLQISGPRHHPKAERISGQQAKKDSK